MMILRDQMNELFKTYGSMDVIQAVGGLNFQQTEIAGVAVQWQGGVSAANSPRSLLRFIAAIQLEIADDLAGVAIGPFDGQPYVWVFVRRFDVDLTRRIYDMKAAVEQQVLGEFEVHVEPVDDAAAVETRLPTGYTLVNIQEQPWQLTMNT